MDHSEARTLVTPFGHITIYHLAGESGWKAVSSDIPPHGLRMTRSGMEGQSSYASDCFLTKFCHEVGLITAPRDGDLQLLAADLLPSFDPESVGQLGIVWSERITSAPTIRVPEPVLPRTPRSILRAIDLDFKKPLRLPDGSDPPPAAFDWTMALKKDQMTYRERRLMDAVMRTLASPGAYVKRIGYEYKKKAGDTLLKLWGVSRRHLRVPPPRTLTMALFDPHHLAYYFRLLACSTAPGRNYSPTTLATEILLLRHLLRAFMTLATRDEAGNCGIRFDQMPHGLDAEDVMRWLEEQVKLAATFKATVGGRRKERDVMQRVTEIEYSNWVGDTLASVEDLMDTSENDGLERTPEMAEYVQDLAVALLCGAGMPPQRADLLATLQLGPGEGGCGVPGCRINNCPGNRVVSRDEYVQCTGAVPEPAQEIETYYILAGHYKNYTADRATYKGPTVHTPKVIGKELNFILGQLAEWGSHLLYGMDNDDEDDDAGTGTRTSTRTTGGTRTSTGTATDDEDYVAPPPVCRYLLVDYEKPGSKPFHSHDRFSQYVKRCCQPISVPPTSHRFLFARMAESSIETKQLSTEEADATRQRMARAMLTTVHEWNEKYSSPRTRMPLAGFDRARDIVYGQGPGASGSSVPS